MNEEGKRHKAYNDIIEFANKRIKEATDEEIEGGFWITYSEEEYGSDWLHQKFSGERYNRQHGVGKSRKGKKYRPND